MSPLTKKVRNPSALCLLGQRRLKQRELLVLAQLAAAMLGGGGVGAAKATSRAIFEIVSFAVFSRKRGFVLVFSIAPLFNSRRLHNDFK